MKAVVTVIGRDAVGIIAAASGALSNRGVNILDITQSVFGNIFVSSSAENRIFFFEKWKVQWKKYKEYKRQAFEEGFEYSADFDIASFYDNIDHQILLQILGKYGVDGRLIELLCRCLSTWTSASNPSFDFQKSCGIPQGPVSSAFFAEVYLCELDRIMRRQTKIKYFRYADDINIMAKNENDCRRMIVFLDLLARDLSLTPQSEKIEVNQIFDIDEHIQNSTLRFSKIAKEYSRNAGVLSEATHKKLKRQFLSCFANPEKFNKTIIQFALFKLNEDDEIRDAIIKNIKLLELFYEGICYYFSRHYPNDPTFDEHVGKYLLGDTVLFQYNKSILFKSYDALPFSDDIFRANFSDEKTFWIVPYQMICWLMRCKREKLASVSYGGKNYYIQRLINKIRCREIAEDETALRVVVEALIADKSPLVSMQGLYLWNEYFLFEKPSVSSENGYSQRVLSGYSFDYFSYAMKELFDVSVPEEFIKQLSADIERYREAKEDIGFYKKYRDVDPSKALQNLNLLNNLIFDMLSETIGYSCSGEYGGRLPQMQERFPIAYAAFSHILTARNQKTDAHYKDKEGNVRVRINRIDFERIVSEANMQEAYSEIFAAYEVTP